MTRFIASLHTDLRRARATRRGATLPPDQVPMGLHKEYPRMERIPFPRLEPESMSLTDALRSRRSMRQARSLEGFELAELGSMLGHALAVSQTLRPYPSGGALYPVETYLIGNVIKGEIPHAYHYHPTDHALEKLWPLPAFHIRDYVTSSKTHHGACFVIFTAAWSRSSAKYGDFSYLHGLLEAGHMAQNILLMAAALKRQARPIGGFDEELVQKALDINTDIEQAVYAITLA